MTDKEIIKALEVCLESKLCAHCPMTAEGYTSNYGTACRKSLLRYTTNLFNRLQAENERLEYTLLGVMHSVDKWLDGAELEQDEVNRAVTMREKTLRIIESKNAEIERSNCHIQKLVNVTDDLVHECDCAKQEAIKNFAERLCEDRVPNDPVVIAVKTEMKFMLGEQE